MKTSFKSVWLDSWLWGRGSLMEDIEENEALQRREDRWTQNKSKTSHFLYIARV